MPDYAIVNNDVVENIIVAESLEAALSVVNSQDIIEVIDGVPGMGWVRDSIGWKSGDEPIWPSWSWNYDTHSYKPPVPYPKDDKVYVWDEDSVSWKVVTPVDND